MRVWRAGSRNRQGGAVAVATAVSAVVLIGFLGIVVDFGRMSVVKTELQNAADACALAAAYELDGNANALTRAENAGIAIATRNLVHLQSQAVAASASDIKFATALSAGGDNSNYITQADGASADSRYVMCTMRLPALAMTLSSIIGMEAKAVAGQAVATLAPAQSSCAIPLGVCKKGGPPNYGLTPGEWVVGRFDSGGGSTGSFNWIDFSPPGGGQNELSALLAGQGTCNTSTGQNVGQSGIMGNAAGKAWNSRFGLYQGGGGNPQLATAPPDFTGYSYTPASWPSQANALPDFLNPRRVNNASYQGTPDIDINNSYNVSTPAQLAQYGASRRLATAPVVDCGGWATSQVVPLEGYVCMLMLHPIGSPGDEVRMEYVGPANAPGSPCSTSGLAGGTTGPLIPVLVQ